MFTLKSTEFCTGVHYLTLIHDKKVSQSGVVTCRVVSFGGVFTFRFPLVASENWYYYRGEGGVVTSEFDGN